MWWKPRRIELGRGKTQRNPQDDAVAASGQFEDDDEDENDYEGKGGRIAG